MPRKPVEKAVKPKAKTRAELQVAIDGLRVVVAARDAKIAELSTAINNQNAGWQLRYAGLAMAIEAANKMLPHGGFPARTQYSTPDNSHRHLVGQWDNAAEGVVRAVEAANALNAMVIATPNFTYGPNTYKACGNCMEKQGESRPGLLFFALPLPLVKLPTEK